MLCRHRICTANPCPATVSGHSSAVRRQGASICRRGYRRKSRLSHTNSATGHALKRPCSYLAEWIRRLAFLRNLDLATVGGGHAQLAKYRLQARQSSVGKQRAKI